MNENHKYNNRVIKVLNKDHGKKVIKWWQDQGIYTAGNEGVITVADGNTSYYYGLVDGLFQNYSLDYVSLKNATIIELPEDPSILKIGDKITLHDIQYEVAQSRTSGYWYLKNLAPGGLNDNVFINLGIIKSHFQIQILGYSESFVDFPECRSLEDLTKFVNAIKDYKIKPEKQYKISADEMRRLYKLPGLYCKWRGIIKENYCDNMLDGTYCLVKYSMVEEARKEANTTQLNVLNEIFKPTYQVGDWVITKGYTHYYDGKALEITKITDRRFCYFRPGDPRSTSNGRHDNFDIKSIERYATEEEINLAKNPCPYKDGDLIWCKYENEWHLNYATGKMTDDGIIQIYKNQKKSGDTMYWAIDHKPATGIKLPE